MLCKLQKPIVANLIPNNICKYGHILDMYIETTLALIVNGHRPAIEILKGFL